MTVDQGRFAIQARGRAVPFATGVLRCQGAVKVAPIDDAVFGKGQAIAVTGSHGGGETFQVFAGLPFVLYEVTLVNSGATACA
ncbi:MAG: hypothetical protein NTW96_03300 [Planctomycetia bacterium]|nr:hypothetical protein [Planctomycetia bacterium]